MRSKYKSPKSVAKNQTIPIDVNDPRLKRINQGRTIARSGAEILPIDFNKNSFLAISASRGGGFGSQSSTNGQVGGQIARNQLPTIQPGIISNLSVEWQGKSLVATFTFDASTEENKYATNFRIYAEAGSNVEGYSSPELFPINTSQTSHTITFTEDINRQTFGTYHSNITNFCVAAVDIKGVASGFNVCVVPDEFATELNAPVITATAKSQGYSVAVTNMSETEKDEFSAIEIWEIESTSSTAPTIEYTPGTTNPSNYTRVYSSSIIPASINTNNLNKRWVIARFGSNAGLFTSFSSAVSVTPESPLEFDNEGPPDVASVTTLGGLDSSGIVGFNGYANVSWSAVTTGGIRGYRIRYRPITTPESSYSYADSPGSGTSYRLSALGAGLTYEIAVATYDELNNTSSNYVSGSNVTVGGTPYIASTVDVTGYFSAKANPSDAESTAFKFGYGVDTGKRGLVFNSNNYWYIDSDQSASLKVGGSTSNYISWDGAEFVIDGDISARKGNFSGNISLDPGASLSSLDTVPTLSITSVSYTATTATYQTSTNHGYLIGDKVSTSGLSPDGYNVVAEITSVTLNTFTIANTTNLALTKSTGSVIKIDGAGFIINKNGLQFNSSIANGVTIINAEDGKLTTTSANIGGWDVTSSEIKKVAQGGGQINLSSNAGVYGSIYVASSNEAKTSGIIASDTGSNGEVAFWAGDIEPDELSTINDTLPDGSKVRDSLSFYVTIDGLMKATDAIITGEIKNGKVAIDDAEHPGFYVNNLGQLLVGGGNNILDSTDFTGLSYIKINDTELTIQSASNGRVVLNVGAENSSTTGLFVSGITKDNADYSKNDITLVAVARDGTPTTNGSGGPYKITRGRRFYWGADNGNPNQYNGGAGSAGNPNNPVVDFYFAQAGDIYFTTVG